MKLSSKIYLFLKSSTILFLLSCFLFGSCANDDTDDVNEDPQSNIDLSNNDQLTIFNIRADNNDAIARHDAGSVATPYLDNFFILTSTNGFFEGKEEVQGIYQSVFDSRTDVIFIRTPNQVQVNTDWNMASEFGEWTGYWVVEGEEINVSGDYYAKWHKVNGSWLLRNEIYTQFNCSGDSVCSNKPMLE